MADWYLIWSNEHGRWWRAGRQGYTPRLSEAGRYSHAAALGICANAIPEDAWLLGCLPEVPVPETDILTMVAQYDTAFPNRKKPEPWE